MVWAHIFIIVLCISSLHRRLPIPNDDTSHMLQAHYKGVLLCERPAPSKISAAPTGPATFLAGKAEGQVGLVPSREERAAREQVCQLASRVQRCVMFRFDLRTSLEHLKQSLVFVNQQTSRCEGDVIPDRILPPLTSKLTTLCVSGMLTYLAQREYPNYPPCPKTPSSTVGQCEATPLWEAFQKNFYRKRGRKSDQTMQKYPKNTILMIPPWHGGHKRMVCGTVSHKWSFPNRVLVVKITAHELAERPGLLTNLFYLVSCSGQRSAHVQAIGMLIPNHILLVF